MSKDITILPNVAAMVVRSSLRESDVYERLLQLIGGPLYGCEKYSAKDFRLLEDGLVLDGVNIDLHCKQCGRQSVFRSTKLQKQLHAEVPEPLMSSTRRNVPREDFASPVVADEFLANLVLNCSRNEVHCIEIKLRLTSTRGSADENLAPTILRVLQKIGQYPTYADLQKPQFSHLSPYLDEIDRVELNKAIGLASHDSAIAAFVYLRRVFERLIEKAHSEAKEGENWDVDVFKKSRMDEKVKLLEGFLPELLVENRRIYSVLSLGIHSLTEDLCASVFDPIRDGILLILEDVHSKRQQSEMKKNLGPSLEKVQAKIDQALSKDSDNSQ